MAIWPERFALPSARARARRLTEIEEGAPERYFEEHRTLVLYQPTPHFLQLWRVGGIVIALTSAGLFVEERRDPEGAAAARIEAGTS